MDLTNFKYVDPNLQKFLKSPHMQRRVDPSIDILQYAIYIQRQKKYGIGFAVHCLNLGKFWTLKCGRTSCTDLFSSLGLGWGRPRVAEPEGPVRPYTRISKLWVADMLEHLATQGFINECLLYVQEVVTRPKILNRKVLSD